MKRVVLGLVRGYQKARPLREAFLESTVGAKGACRFRPTCSQYAYEAISRYGTIRGTILSLGRIARCHPWAKGGWDPVPRKFKT